MTTKKPAKKPSAKKPAAKFANAPSIKVQTAAPVISDAQAGPASKASGLKIESNRPQQNGVTRPSVNSLCDRVWRALDSLHASGTEITTEAIRALAGAEMADATIRTQRQRWRTFLGLPRNAKPKAAATEASNPA